MKIEKSSLVLKADFSAPWWREYVIVAILTSIGLIPFAPFFDYPQTLWEWVVRVAFFICFVLVALVTFGQQDMVEFNKNTGKITFTSRMCYIVRPRRYIWDLNSFQTVQVNEEEDDRKRKVYRIQLVLQEGMRFSLSQVAFYNKKEQEKIVHEILKFTNKKVPKTHKKFKSK